MTTTVTPPYTEPYQIQTLNAQERELFAKYGKLPTHKNVLTKMQRVSKLFHILPPLITNQERKYFDSGDYALSKAGVASQSTVGTAIPNPEKSAFPVIFHMTLIKFMHSIPHASSPGNGHAHQALSVSPTNSTSPVNRESGLAHNEDTNVPQSEDASQETAGESSDAPIATEIKAAE